MKGEEALVISYVIQTRQTVVSINSSVRRALDRQVIRLFSISVIRFPVSVQHVPRAWRKSCWSKVTGGERKEKSKEEKKGLKEDVRRLVRLSGAL